MRSKQSHGARPPLVNGRRVSSSCPNGAPRRKRRFLAFCAFLVTLLLGSSLLRAFSFASTPTAVINSRPVAFTGSRILSTNVDVLGAKASEDDHQRLNVVATAGQVIRHKTDEALSCDRSHYRTDVCEARGDVRVVGGWGHGSGCFQVLALTDSGQERVELVKPYTRKWEEGVMRTIDEVKVIRKLISRSSKSAVNVFQADAQLAAAAAAEPEHDTRLHDQDHHRNEKGAANAAANYNTAQIKWSKQKPPLKKIKRRGSPKRRQQYRINKAVENVGRRSWLELDHEAAAVLHVPNCEVQHEMPAILFSTGGYTGNVYHEFNDGLIPLFITAQQFGLPAGEVVLIVLEYHPWWFSKYEEVLAQITNYPIIDLIRDTRVHCFPQVTVGLLIHGELSIDAHKQDDAAASMQGFQAMLQVAYRRSLQSAKKPILLLQAPSGLAVANMKQPKLVVLSRKGSSRVLLNQKEVVRLARNVGFAVQVLSPKQSTSMAEIYGALNGCDVVLGVHGAAMTHLVFMRPGATLIQVVPLGTEWAAHAYYGVPARKLGLTYVEYKISPRESSLWEHYASDDPVLADPDSVNSRGGWWETKRIYLQAQNVTISLANTAAILRSVYARAAATKRPNFS